MYHRWCCHINEGLSLHHFGRDLRNMVGRLVLRLGPDRWLKREGEQRAVLCKDLSVFDQQEAAVVQIEQAIVETSREDCVSLPRFEVANDHEAEILSRDAGEQQSRKLRNCVVFVITFTGTECHERRTPHIGGAMLHQCAR